MAEARHLKSESEEILDAEKGKNLSPRNLHLRLRVLEVVLLVTVLLNLLHWFVQGTVDKKINDRLDTVEQNLHSGVTHAQ